MSVGEISALMQGGIGQVLTLVLPVLGAALVVGLIIAIFQATTSIQEQTLTFLPKFLIILVILMLFGGMMFTNLGDYVIRLFAKIPDMAK